jgi:hypothetical protein
MHLHCRRQPFGRPDARLRQIGRPSGEGGHSRGGWTRGKIRRTVSCQSGAPSERPAAEWTGIRILSATDGKNCGARIGNVTEALEKACGTEKGCDNTVDVNRLCDPADGCDKSLFVKYQCGGGTSTRLAGPPSQPGYGRVIHLACP